MDGTLGYSEYLINCISNLWLLMDGSLYWVLSLATGIAFILKALKEGIMIDGIKAFYSSRHKGDSLSF